MPPSIDVIVPIHGGRPVTERCLLALARQTCEHGVTVVDNASPDDSVARLRAEWPAVAVLELGANRGFAAACNAGIAATAGDVVVLLNNDVEADPDMLEQLCAGLASEPAAGMAAPMLLRPGRERLDGVGLSVDRTLAGFPRHQGLPPARAGDGAPRLLGPSGAAGAYKRAALAAAGGLDERIFMYAEDVDLALRVRAAGWSAVAVPAARAVHLGSASAGRRSAWQRRQFGFARGYLLRRWSVLRGRAAVRALVTEAIVAAGDAAISRDLAALQGRVAGWRAGRGGEQRALPEDAVAGIGMLETLRLRRADYAIEPAS